VYPHFLHKIRKLVSNYFKKNNLLNVKKYNKLLYFKYNIKLALFSKKKKAEKRFNKYKIFQKFLIK
jgi:hypothetical protein